MYRFLWRPAWIVSHILILALIVSMIMLGLWQLRRLDEKQDRNRQIEANTAAEPLGVGD
ncbi:MAG: SURF1 family cytochrome oxidase biogenesis protein, partial [Ilumatobacteraceae bacterium]